MKKLLFVLCILLFSISVSAKKIHWLYDTDRYKIEIPGGVIMYPCNEAPTYRDGSIRMCIKLDEAGAIENKKAKKYEVCGYANIEKRLEYDTYVLSIGKKYYYVPVDVVKGDINLEAWNGFLVDEYAELSASYESGFKELESLVKDQLFLAKAKMEGLNAEMSELSSRKDSVVLVAAQEYDAMVKAEYDSWYNSLSSSVKKSLGYLSVTSSELGSPNSAGGCDYRLYYVNRSKKVIKYLTWYGNAYNAVDDKVACSARQRYDFSGQETGPIESGAVGGGMWDCVVYNFSARSMRLSRIDIEYMDGSVARVPGADVVAMLASPSIASNSVVRAEHGGLSAFLAKKTSGIEKEISVLDAKIKTYNKNVNFFESNYKYTGDWQVVTQEFSEAARRVVELSKQVKEANKLLNEFKAYNLLTTNR